MDFLETSIVEIADRVRSGGLAAARVVGHSLERIEALNPALNAFVAIDADAAEQAASRIDAQVAAGHDPGPLAGIPIGVKDLEDASGFVTTHGSPLHSDDPVRETDSILVDRLKEAGAIVIGKTNTPEFGHTGTTDNDVFGATANPWDITKSSGGSSGGSAAAIASGMVPLATGSDGGGSIRLPAALCGFTGLKCQQGRIAYFQDGTEPAMLLGTPGPMARTAADTAFAFDVVRGPHWADPFSLPADDRSWFDAAQGAAVPDRVVWAPTMGFADVDPGIAARCQEAVDALAESGTEVIIDDTLFDEQPSHGWSINWFAYMHARLGRHRGTPNWDKISPVLQDMVERGAEINGDDAVEGLSRMFARNHDVGSLMDRHNAAFLLTPTIAQFPPTLEEIRSEGRPSFWVQFTFGINMTRHPAGSVCIGMADGLPVGLQVIGRHFDEPGVLATMSAIERQVGSIGRPHVS